MAQCDAKVLGKQWKVTGSSRFEKHCKAQTIYDWHLSSFDISCSRLPVVIRVQQRCDKVLDCNWIVLSDQWGIEM